jgi:signal transduction histidine kinase
MRDGETIPSLSVVHLDVKRTGDPSWLVPLACAVPVLAAIAVVLQRIGTATASWAVPLAVVTALPWLAAAFGLTFPKWAAAVLLLGATAALVWYPTDQGAAPFQLIALVAVTVLVGSTRDAVAVWAASVAVMASAELAGRFEGSTLWILGISLGGLGAYAMKTQARVQDSLLAQATVEERQRIARELHDVVAHSLAVTMLNLTGARRALRRDPAEAEDALRQAEESGRQSLADIRRAVGLLGSSGELTALPAAPDIDTLVGEFAGAGLRVTFIVDGDVASVPTVTGLALYRIAEESMANVVKHAPGSEARVMLTVEPVSVRLSVCSRGPKPLANARGDGLGITGMRERAALVGGTLEAGADGTGWRVVADLPIGAT